MTTAANYGSSSSNNNNNNNNNNRVHRSMSPITNWNTYWKNEFN